MLHSRGHGYANQRDGSPDCTAFDGLEPIANPLGMFDESARESRSFYPPAGGTGVTYSSHALQIGVRVREDWQKPGRQPDKLYFMMSHGGGREVYSLRNGVYHQPIADILTALPERDLYSLGYSIWEGQQESRRQAIEETDAKWRKALAEGRVAKRRAKGGRAAYYEIEDSWETAERERKAHNKRALAAAA